MTRSRQGAKEPASSDIEQEKGTTPGGQALNRQEPAVRAIAQRSDCVEYARLSHQLGRAGPGGAADGPRRGIDPASEENQQALQREQRRNHHCCTLFLDMGNPNLVRITATAAGSSFHYFRTGKAQVSCQPDRDLQS